MSENENERERERNGGEFDGKSTLTSRTVIGANEGACGFDRYMYIYTYMHTWIHTYIFNIRIAWIRTEERTREEKRYN